MSGRFLSAALLLALPLAATADNAGRVSAGKLVTDTATVLARKASDIPWDWTPVAKGAEVFSEDQLIGLPDSVIESGNGAIRLTLRTDLSNRSPFPIVETAVRLNPPTKDWDLDLWLDRGRIDITNLKKTGTAKVRVHFRTRVWELILEKPGTRLAMEIFGRWPQGARFSPKPKSGDGPLTSLLLVVIEGEVQRSCSFCTVAMRAAPGPAYFSWDSVHGDDKGAQKLEKSPAWVEEIDAKTPAMQARLARREILRKTIATKGLGEALVDMLEDKEPEVRRNGVYALGAFDQLPSLGAVLRRSNDMETWSHAVVALRHWLGRGPGQEVKLYELLKANREYTDREAAYVLQMLMGFAEEDTDRPELFKLLIDLLKYDKLAIRGLAYWHLLRLAPMVKVKFNPNGDAAERDRAWKDYKAAIPDDKVPGEKN